MSSNVLSFFFNEINFRTPRIISLFLRYVFKPWLRSISIVRNIIENRVFNSSRFNGFWNKESYRIEYMWNFKGKGFFNGCVCFAWSRNDQHCFCLKLFPLKLRHLFVKNCKKFNNTTVENKLWGQKPILLLLKLLFYFALYP